MVNRTGGLKGVQESWVIFKDSLLRAQERSIAMCRRSIKCGRKAAWMNSAFLTQLKREKEVHRRRKQ